MEFEQTSLLEKKYEMMKTQILDEELRLNEMEMQHKKNISYGIGMIVIAVLLIGLALLFPDFAKEDIKKDNPMTSFVLAAVSLVSVAKYFFMALGAFGGIMAVRFLMRAFSATDSQTGITGNYALVSQSVSERLAQKKMTLRSLSNTLEQRKKEENRQRLEMLKKAKESKTEESVPSGKIFRPNLTGITKGEDGTFQMSLEDALRELQEE